MTNHENSPNLHSQLSKQVLLTSSLFDSKAITSAVRRTILDRSLNPLNIKPHPGKNFLSLDVIPQTVLAAIVVEFPFLSLHPPSVVSSSSIISSSGTEYRVVSLGTGCRSVGHRRIWEQCKNKIFHTSNAHHLQQNKNNGNSVGRATLLSPSSRSIVALTSPSDGAAYNKDNKLVVEGGDAIKSTLDAFVLYDGHAEVMARRGLCAYLLKEMEDLMQAAVIVESSHQSSLSPSDANEGEEKTRYLLMHQADDSADYSLLSTQETEKNPDTVPFKLRPGVKLHLYITHPPCGDSSIILEKVDSVTGAPVILKPISSTAFKTNDATTYSSLSSLTAPASLTCITSKNKNPMDSFSFFKHLYKDDERRIQSHFANSVSPFQKKGQHDTAYLPRSLISDSSYPYHQRAVGFFRTKPGKGVPTLSMSCSDKIALWLKEGLQGTALMRLVGQIPLSSIIVGIDGYSECSSLPPLTTTSSLYVDDDNFDELPVNLTKQTRNILYYLHALKRGLRITDSTISLAIDDTSLSKLFGVGDEPATTNTQHLLKVSQAIMPPSLDPVNSYIWVAPLPSSSSKMSFISSFLPLPCSPTQIVATSTTTPTILKRPRILNRTLESIPTLLAITYPNIPSRITINTKVGITMGSTVSALVRLIQCVAEETVWGGSVTGKLLGTPMAHECTRIALAEKVVALEKEILRRKTEKVGRTVVEEKSRCKSQGGNYEGEASMSYKVLKSRKKGYEKWRPEDWVLKGRMRDFPLA